MAVWSVYSMIIATGRTRYAQPVPERLHSAQVGGTKVKGQLDLRGSMSISGVIRSSGNGNTMVEDLPLLDMSASVCR